MVLSSLNVLDLFSGIGGFSLGLERAGFKTVAFCEIDKYCQKVLNKHWPNVPIYEDVKTLNGERLRADGITDIGVITGGFPCQDISVAGKQKGIEGERSGLWTELVRIISDIRPNYAIMENVTNLISGDRGRWFGRVLGDLAEIGYDCEWHCIPASAIGAPHQRDRVWIIAHSNSDSKPVEPFNARQIQKSNMADAIGIKSQLKNFSDLCGWKAEPNVGRVANGVSARVDRLKGLGNAVVPQIPEIIGRAILND